MKTKLLRKFGLHASFLMLFIFVINTCFSQNEGQVEAIMNEINSIYISKLEETFKKNQERADKMKSELEEVDKIKENQGKKKALENYSRNHKAQYGQMVREAGVNLNSVVARLKSRFPAYSFTIVDDFSILIEEVRKESNLNGGTGSIFPERHEIFETQGFGYANLYPESSDIHARGPMAIPDYETGHSYPAYAFSGITSTQELSFSQRKDVRCALGSGGVVELGARFAKATSTGAIGGECTSTGWLENTVVLPTGVQSVRLRLNTVFEVNAFALGLLGAAVSSADCIIRYSVQNQVSERTIGGLSRFVVAPIFWYGSFNQSNSWGTTIDLTAFRGSTLKVTGLASSYSLAAVCCATNATSRLTFTGANLEIVR